MVRTGVEKGGGGGHRDGKWRRGDKGKSRARGEYSSMAPTPLNSLFLFTCQLLQLPQA